MDRDQRIKMTITMDVSPAQALALKAMFEHWNYLANIGSSRNVSFFVDGDGDFHPNCKIETDKELPELTEELERLAVVEDKGGHRKYDYDGIAWKIYHPE